MYDFLFGKFSKKKRKRLSKKTNIRPKTELIKKAKSLGISITVVKKGCRRRYKSNEELRKQIRLKIKKCKDCRFICSLNNPGYNINIGSASSGGSGSSSTGTSNEHYYGNPKLRLLHDFIKIEEQREIIEQKALAIKAKREVLETNITITEDNIEKKKLKEQLDNVNSQEEYLKKSTEELVKAESDFVNTKIKDIKNEPPKQIIIKNDESLKLIKNITEIKNVEPIIKIEKSIPKLSQDILKKSSPPPPPPMPPKKMLALPPPPKKSSPPPPPPMPPKKVNLDKFKKSVKKVINTNNTTNIPKKEPKTWDLACKGRSKSDIELFGLEYANPSKYANKEELSKLKSKALLVSHPDKGCPGKSEWMNSLGPKPNSKEGCSKTLNNILAAYKNINKNCVI